MVKLSGRDTVLLRSLDEQATLKRQDKAYKQTYEEFQRRLRQANQQVPLNKALRVPCRYKLALAFAVWRVSLLQEVMSAGQPFESAVQVRQGAEKAAMADRRALLAGANPVYGQRKLQSQEEVVDAAEDVTSSLQRTRQLLAQARRPCARLLQLHFLGNTVRCLWLHTASRIRQGHDMDNANAVRSWIHCVRKSVTNEHLVLMLCIANLEDVSVVSQ